MRDLKSLPIEYQQVFGPPGRYHMIIQVDSVDAAPIQVLVEVEAEAGPEPKVSGIWRGIARIRLLDQQSPRIADGWDQEFEVVPAVEGLGPMNGSV
jgi:hypothetical protein